MTATPCRARAKMIGRVSAYLDGELTPAECAAIKRHCRDCSRCRSIVAGLRRTVGLCRKAGAAPLPAAVRKRARESVRRLLNA